MTRSSIAPLLVLIAVAVGIGSGCDSETGVEIRNRPPNTRISAGPPEASDTGFNVEINWFGWDDDGRVDHYEIAWETPEEWIGPVFSPDSLFKVEASETCCVEGLPEFGVGLPERVYQQYHTFYVRSVDDDGLPDPTPAVRSFNSKTIAPYTKPDDSDPPEGINFGPPHLGRWGTSVEFEWLSADDDGVVVGAFTAQSSRQEFIFDFDRPPADFGEIVAWIDTLTFRPQPGGGYSDERVWVFTEEDSILYPSLPVNPTTEDLYFFAVRAVDDAGAIEKILQVPHNIRGFRTTSGLDGPRITLISNIAGTWSTGDPAETREVFAGQGLRFRWTAQPGASLTPVVGFSYAVDDTAEWSAFSANNTEWPQQIPNQPERLWFPDSGPHSFFLRAIDEGGFIRLLVANIEVFPGPRFCPVENRTILIVLDTSPQNVDVWSTDYPATERGLIDYWFDGYGYQVIETRGADAPDVNRLDCATSVFWFHSADLDNGDPSILDTYHSSLNLPNILPSYISSGGNLALFGLQPANGIRYFEQTNGDNPILQGFPINFQNAAQNEDLVPHWMFTLFEIQRIGLTTGNTVPGTLSDQRLSLCTSEITTGSNPYPDLAFDPLTWPQGPTQGGFGFYDSGIIPDPMGTAEVIYSRVYENDEGTTVRDPIGVRRLTSPGVNGNLVYLGFHPYFVERPTFKQFIQAVLDDFGEVPVNP